MVGYDGLLDGHCMLAELAKSRRCSGDSEFWACSQRCRRLLDRCCATLPGNDDRRRADQVVGRQRAVRGLCLQLFRRLRSDQGRLNSLFLPTVSMSPEHPES